MNSADPRRFRDEDDSDVLRGQYQGHPYGELNLVLPLNKGAELKGLQGWQGPGMLGIVTRLVSWVETESRASGVFLSK